MMATGFDNESAAPAPLFPTYDSSALSLAMGELARNSLAVIQLETAEKWAYRARAARVYAYEALRSGDNLLAARWMRDATEYTHEAIEHAALCGDDRILHAVRRITRGV
jgi:hypothetical protein